MTAEADDRFTRRWRTLTWLTALVAFLALLNTRELSFPVAVIFLAAWLLGVFLRRTPGWWRPWMGQAATLAAVPVILLMAGFVFFNSVLYLLLYLCLAKCYALRLSRDYLEAQVLCFFVLLSTSAMTISVDFAVFFIAWTVLLCLNLVCFGIARQKERAAGGVYPLARFRVTGANSPRGLMLLGASVSVLVFALTVIIFFLVPHVEMRSINAPLSRRNVPRDRLTGFSEEVSFGQFKDLIPNDTVVMNIEVSFPPGAEGRIPDSMRVRGMALDYYDEESWQSYREGDRQHIHPTDQIVTPSRTLQRGRVVNATVYQNTDITMRLFAPSMPMEIKLKGKYRVRQVHATLSYQIFDFGDTRESSYTNPLIYDCRSNMVEDVYDSLPKLIRDEKEFLAQLEAEGGLSDPDRLQRARRNTLADHAFHYRDIFWLNEGQRRVATADDREVNLQLPDTRISRRIGELARQVAPGPSETEILYQLTRFLREEFTYTLSPETPSGMHPIEGFLFSTRKGHCEYFATALALMLRSRGVSARIVNGFYTTEWNPMAEVYSVKQSDAHSWVEAWLDGPGWLTIDPTPPGNAGRAAYGLSAPTWLQTWSEYIRLQWQRFVIDYTAGRQAEFIRDLKEFPGLRMLVAGFERAMGLMRRESRTGGGTGSADDSGDLPGKAADFVVLGAIAAGLWLLAGRVRRKRRRGSDRTGVDYLDRLLRELEKTGVRRSPASTPAELLARHPVQGMNELDLGWVTDLYNRERFAGRPATSQERARAMEIAASVARAMSAARAR